MKHNGTLSHSNIHFISIPLPLQGWTAGDVTTQPSTDGNENENPGGGSGMTVVTDAVTWIGLVRGELTPNNALSSQLVVSGRKL